MKTTFLMLIASFLLAAQTINLLPFSSSDFGPNWQKSYIGLGAATVLAPDGASQAQSLDGIADPNVQVRLMQTDAVSIKQTDSESISLFLKAGSLHQVVLVNVFSENGAPGAITSRVDLNTGNVINTSTDCCAPFASYSATVTNAGNGWWRVGVSVIVPHGHKIDSVTPILQLEQASGGPYLDTTGQTNLIYLWGAQIDKGASPLPYQAVQ